MARTRLHDVPENLLEEVARQHLHDWLMEHATSLPLQQALRHGAEVILPPDQIMWIASGRENGAPTVHVGIFFRSRMPGCACADDPTPEPEFNEYAELELRQSPGENVLDIRLVD
ncbi:MAG: hypothetical protein D6717_14490 [Gammaproteobacteria bacterium]|nr:MAG: hypothetical protein D6717_14490 [Gammaproteobacteria bacterium]